MANKFRNDGDPGLVAITDLTDSTGGTAGDTIANLTGVDGTGSNAAPLAGTEDAIASLAAKINELTAELRKAGVIA